MHGLETIRKINDLAVAAMAESGVAVKASTTSAEQAELDDIAQLVAMCRYVKTGEDRLFAYDAQRIADYLVAAYGITEE